MNGLRKVITSDALTCFIDATPWLVIYFCLLVYALRVYLAGKKSFLFHQLAAGFIIDLLAQLFVVAWLIKDSIFRANRTSSVKQKMPDCVSPHLWNFFENNLQI